MPKLTDICFSENDLSAIEAAVKNAESKTSGELAIQIVEQSRNWTAERLFVAAICAILSVGAALWFTRETHWDVYYDFTQALFWGMIGFVLGFAAIWKLVFWRFTRRRKEVFHDARKVFLALPKTTAETAVLIFVSLKENVAEIIVDKAIATKVSADYWEQVDQKLIESIKSGKHSEGIIAAVNEIGNTLATHFPRTSDDRNELPDRPKLG